MAARIGGVHVRAGQDPGTGLTAYEDVNCVTLCFTDKAELVVDVEPCLVFSADYSDWITGNQPILKHWLPLRSE